MPVKIVRGDSPLILTLPHAATDIPMVVMRRLNARGQALTDTDWHVDHLFEGLVEDATVIRANFHRYLCNANGNPTRSTTDQATDPDAIVPVCNLDRELIWRVPPTRGEMRRWGAAFHTPYHAAIAAEVAYRRAKHGHALLIDCHAVRQHAAPGTLRALPDIGIRTNRGASCDHALAARLAGICMSATSYETAIHEGETDGWTVSRYGRPKQNVHALQVEVARSCYLSDDDGHWRYDREKAEPLREVLRDLLVTARNWAPQRSSFPLQH
ncbi:N-formylglutamate amidohydrolase [Roseobacter sinensis]|uniref:N-formylglutamate amidohydrolase n=1 Tax=Roseobacter sinensis TaxID=2931391 RepID=A0ABT3BHA1_9RHOB|nr:N-formylglutamate amidohydrolase [Roseobacter sp. WL0113]MCV3272927.1 N-formylglutamate amidohydrolase [Roseobacter sp. WL0113]